MEKSKKGGLTQEAVAELGSRELILKNLCWKPDQLFKNGMRQFFPYLDIGFVKERLIEVCGAGNVQFTLEKENGQRYAIGSMGIFIDGDWVWNTAIGTERDSNLKDQTKRDKVVFKGNHSDAYKSCAELFGIIVPNDVKGKLLKEKDNVVYTPKDAKIGHINYNKDAINAYLNGMNQSLILLAQVYKSNADLLKNYPEVEVNFRSFCDLIKKEGK